MAAEVQFTSTAGAAHYYVLQDGAGQFRRQTGGAFEAYNAANWADYAHSASELGAGFFSGDQPGGLSSSAVYRWTALERSGGSPATTDAKRASGELGDTASNRIRTWLNQAVSTNNLVIAGIGTVVSSIQGSLGTSFASVLAKLNAAIVRVTSPVVDDGSLEIVAGDDYRSADGKALAWTVRDWSGPALGTINVVLRFVRQADYLAAGTNSHVSAALEVTGTVSAAGDDALFEVELTAEQSASLEAVASGANRFNYVYQLVATDGDSHKQTMALGGATVKRGLISG